MTPNPESRRAPGIFSERVVAIALSIPAGRVATYGLIARAAGGGGMAAQSITAILGKATERGVKGIPYHRIVYAGGRVWMNPAHRAARLKLYKKEGIVIGPKDMIVNFDAVLLRLAKER
ncbi:MAG: 6-O-methylguanine methyltransferase, binding domain [Candidatus Parcubacteria bacterium]|jgi:methylated-DNA-protein-cysteine methyltransferase-like protein